MAYVSLILPSAPYREMLSSSGTDGAVFMPVVFLAGTVRYSWLRIGLLLPECCGYDITTFVATFGTKIDDVVGTLDNVEVMLDDDNAVSPLDQRVESFEQFSDVVEMQAGGRLVEDEEGRVGLFLTQVVSQFDALVFASRQGGRRLSQLDVAQTDFLQRLQFLYNLFLSVLCEEFDSLVDSHLQYVVDAHVVELHFQRVGLETFAVARFTLQHQVGHELHFDGDGTFALTFLAPSAFAVEAEIAGGVSHLFSQWLFGPEFSYLVVSLDVSHRIASR